MFLGEEYYFIWNSHKAVSQNRFFCNFVIPSSSKNESQNGKTSTEIDLVNYFWLYLLSGLGTQLQSDRTADEVQVISNK